MVINGNAIIDPRAVTILLVSSIILTQSGAVKMDLLILPCYTPPTTPAMLTP